MSGIIIGALGGLGQGMQATGQALNASAMQDQQLAGQKDLLQMQNDLALQKEQAVLDMKSAAAQRERQTMADSIAQAQQGVINGQMGQTYGDYDAALSGTPNSGTPLTPEQQAVIQKAAPMVQDEKASSLAHLAADPHTYITAAMSKGYIDPSKVAELAMHEDEYKRAAAQVQANHDHDDAKQSRQFDQQLSLQDRQFGQQLKLLQARTNADKSDPKVVQATAQMVADGDATIGLRDPDRSEILAAAKKINPDYNEGDYKAAYHAKQAWVSGHQADQVRFTNNALEHLNTLKGMADALNNKDTVLYNKLANALAKQTGNAAVTNFDTARQLVGQEVVKAIVPGAGGEKEREAAANAFATSGAPGQILGAANTYIPLLATQVHGMQQQYNSSNPVYVKDPSKSDFARFLTAGTRSVTGIQPPAGKPSNWGLADQGAGGATVPNPVAQTGGVIDFGSLH
jgi:hypothetical protein